MLSKDILNYSLAFSALLVAVSFTWLLSYLIRMMRIAFMMLDAWEKKLARFEEALHGIRERLEHLSAYAGVIAAGAKTLFSFVQDKMDGEGKHKKKEKE